MKRSSRVRVALVAALVAALAAGGLLVASPWSDHSPDPATSARAIVAMQTTTPDEMLDRWRRILVGDLGLDVAREPFATARAEADDVVGRLLETFEPGSGEPWSDLDTARLVDAQVSFERLGTLALAWGTPGSEYAGDDDLRAEIVSAFSWMIEHRYHVGVDPGGNWWNTRLGFPLAALRIVVVLDDALDADVVRATTDAIESFTPDVTYSGANRAWAAMVVALRGVVVGDEAKIASSRDAIAPLLTPVRSGDGFSEDGSFVQHENFAYTGFYGSSLLATLSDLLLLLQGSPWEYPPDQLDVVASWVADAFDPLLIDGSLIDSVRGRAVTRETRSSALAGTETISAMTALSLALPDEPAGRVAAIAARHLADRSGAFWSAADPTHLAFAVAALEIEAAAEPPGATVYPRMQRAIFRGPGYAFALSLSGGEMARYESINGENERGWYSGSGMTYLYDGGTDPFAGDFWATVDRYRLAGTTVDSRELAPRAGAADIPVSASTGGVVGTDGRDAVVAYADTDERTGLSSRTAWLKLGDAIVVVGSGITAGSSPGLDRHGNPARVESIVDNRPIGIDDVVVADGSTFADVGEAADWLSWRRAGADTGFLLLGATSASLAVVANEGSWSDDNTYLSSTDVRTERYLETWIDHGEQPRDAEFAYVILPGHDAAATEAAAAEPGVVVLTSTPEATAVADCRSGAVAVHFWAAGSVEIPGLGTLNADAVVSVVLEPADRDTLLTAGAGWATGAASTVDIRTGNDLATRVTVSLDDARQADVRVEGVPEVGCG